MTGLPLEFLTGVSVLEMGDGVAGAAAASFLGGLGASVTKIVNTRAPYRRCGLHFARPDEKLEAVLPLVLDAGKTIAATFDGAPPMETGQRDFFGRSSPSYDIVICDRVERASRMLDVRAYCAWVAEVNPGAWITISAFGLTGRRADVHGTDLTVSASAGVLAANSDDTDEQPLRLAGQQALLSTGQAAALASCQALELARDGMVHMDLSAREATIATGPILSLARHLFECGATDRQPYGAPQGSYPCRDGVVTITAMEDHQWRGLVQAMETPQWTQEFDSMQDRIERDEELRDRIILWTAEQSKADVEHRLQECGVPATALYSPLEILNSEQLRVRGCLRTEASPSEHSVSFIHRPFTVAPHSSKQPRAAGARALRGLRVLELGHVVAVPLAAALLGAIGCAVVKLEDPNRVDLYRRRAPYLDGEASLESAVYFQMVNHSKSSTALDPEAEADRFKAVLDRADVVLENLGLRRARRLGLDAADGGVPTWDKLLVSVSGFGHAGPKANFRAYASNLHATCLLSYAMSQSRGRPVEAHIPAWADFQTAYTVATVVAAWAVGPMASRGARVDLAMAEVVISRFNDLLAAASLDGEETGRATDEPAPYLLEGMYKTADAWIVLTIHSDSEWESLISVLGRSDSPLPRTIATSRSDLKSRTELDGYLRSAVATIPAAKLVSPLRERGVMVERVIGPSELLRDGDLADRDFFVSVEHAKFGRLRLVGLPWRPYGGSAIRLSAAPSFGSTATYGW
jgi:crotonobetainyl-CoA:carnitine CoA-transferase CaiB-like acyl-CoA transferase